MNSLRTALSIYNSRTHFIMTQCRQRLFIYFLNVLTQLELNNLFIIWNRYLRLISLTKAVDFLFFIIKFCFTSSIGVSFLERRLRGKHINGRLKTTAHAPNTKKPSHQAPIHLGSLGVMSTAEQERQLNQNEGRVLNSSKTYLSFQQYYNETGWMNLLHL